MDVVISGDAEEDSLLGCETEGLIGKLAEIFIDGAEGAYGWDLADVGFAMEDDFEDSLLGIAAGRRDDVVQVRGERSVNTSVHGSVGRLSAVDGAGRLERRALAVMQTGQVIGFMRLDGGLGRPLTSIWRMRLNEAWPRRS